MLSMLCTPPTCLVACMNTCKAGWVGRLFIRSARTSQKKSHDGGAPKGNHTSHIVYMCALCLFFRAPCKATTAAVSSASPRPKQGAGQRQSVVALFSCGFHKKKACMHCRSRPEKTKRGGRQAGSAWQWHVAGRDDAVTPVVRQPAVPLSGAYRV